jgi:hypothetical protein
VTLKKKCRVANIMESSFESWIKHKFQLNNEFVVIATIIKKCEHERIIYDTKLAMGGKNDREYGMFCIINIIKS